MGLGIMLDSDWSTVRDILVQGDFCGNFRVVRYGSSRLGGYGAEWHQRALVGVRVASRCHCNDHQTYEQLAVWSWVARIQGNDS